MVFVVSLLTAGPAFAIARQDTSTVEWRQFDEQEIEKLRKNPDYIYERQETEARNWLTEFWKWLEQFLPDEPDMDKGSGAGGGFLGQMLSLLFILILVSLIVWGLTKARFRGFISGKGKRVALDYEVAEENIHEIEYVTELQKAEQDRNFRKAVRLRYLEALKILTDKGWIEWRPNKTNHEYFRELRGSAYLAKFRELTTIFDYVWYGEFEVNDKDYESFASDFKTFAAGVDQAPPRPESSKSLLS